MEVPLRRSANLPSLPALRAFEAVGRLMSFRKAGEELLITQSAVSHHIARLEQELGVRLFIRHARSISFSAEGERYYAHVARGFENIATGTRELRRQLAHHEVRVSMLASFAANWLAPRLSRFAEDHPDIDLIIDPGLSLVDLAAEGMDLAIRYGNGSWKGTEARLLTLEQLAPVASPEFAARAALSEPGDVLGHRLLLSTPAKDWEAWAREQRLDLGGAESIQLNDYNVVLQAAADGQGIAMGRLFLIGDWIRRGKLKVLTDHAVTTPDIGHWLVTPAGQAPSKACRRVADWIALEAARSDIG